MALAIAWLIPSLIPITSTIYVALFATFIAAVFTNIRREHKVACGCFGLVQSSRLGWNTISRNALLLLIASFPISAAIIANGGGEAVHDLPIMVTLHYPSVVFASATMFILLPIWIDLFVDVQLSVDDSRNAHQFLRHNRYND